jgi:hypothetical protein
MPGYSPGDKPTKTMPTGYTEKLMKTGMTFPEFAMLCARAMGACIMMRDEPLGAEIPKFEPGDFNAKAAKESEVEYNRLAAMDRNEAVAFGNVKIRKNLNYYRKALTTLIKQNERLTEMLEMVRAWQPPTPNHVGLKEFMVDQIGISIEDPKFTVSELESWAIKDPLIVWNEAKIDALDDMELNKKEHVKEVHRTNARNAWVESLKYSLKES